MFALWLFYKLALENISWHHFKRFYLLGSIVVSAIIPLIAIRVTHVEIPSIPLEPFVPSNPQNTRDLIYSSHIETSNQSIFEWMHVVWALYGLGVILMTYRFLKNLMSLRISTNDTITKWNSLTIVRKKELEVPCSFLRRIYLPAGLEVPEHILNHEKAHIDQRHSWDILFIETFLIVLWFHPLLYLYKYSIKLNHEFLADQAVLKNGFDLKAYQQSLLAYIERSKSSALVHTYNFPIIKKRFTIMKTNTQTYSGILRTLIIIPIVAALVYSCGKEKEEAVIIDHSIKIAPENQENHVFAYDVNPYQKKGFTVYNQVKYKYEIQDDFTVRLFTLNGKEIDQKLNKMEPFMKWDSKKELDRLLKNPEKTEKAINDKKLIVQQSVKAMDTTSATFEVITKDPMSFDQLKKVDPEKILLSKYFENGVEYINIMDIVSFSATSKEDIIYIDNNSPSGKITIQGKTYSYTNTESGIKIFDQNDQEINWYEKGWDIRERLVVPTKNDSFTNSESFKLNNNKAYHVSRDSLTENDLKHRETFLRATDLLKEPKTLKINGKVADKKKVLAYINNHSDCDVLFLKKGEMNILEFSENDGVKMTEEQLQEQYALLFQNTKKQESTKFVAVSEKDWKVITFDADVSSGNFVRRGNEYSYDATDLEKIIVKRKNGEILTDKEFKELNVGFHPVWINGEEKYADAIKKPNIIESFKRGEFAVFYPGGYTKDYEEALSLDASNTFLYFSTNYNGRSIVLNPHTWAFTNPSLKQFQEKVEKLEKKSSEKR